MEQLLIENLTEDERTLYENAIKGMTIEEAFKVFDDDALTPYVSDEEYNIALYRLEKEFGHGVTEAYIKYLDNTNERETI